jgi:hypothetical protein
MITAPDYPVYKHKKIGLQAAAVNDGLHMHSILAIPLKSRLKEDIASHVARKPFLYRKLPLRSIEFRPVETDLFLVTDYIMKSVKREDVGGKTFYFCPKAPQSCPGNNVQLKHNRTSRRAGSYSIAIFKWE